MSMLSDERIAELADKYYSPVGNTKNIEQAIKDGIREAIESQAVPNDLSEDIPQDWKGVDAAVAWHLIDRHCDSWQSIGLRMDEWAKANYVPVIGPAVAYLVPYQTHTGDVDYQLSFQPSGAIVGHVVNERIPLYTAPAASITAAELEALRKDAERYRWLRDDAFEHSDDCFMEAGRLFAEKYGVAFDKAIDAAVAQGKGE